MSRKGSGGLSQHTNVRVNTRTTLKSQHELQEICALAKIDKLIKFLWNNLDDNATTFGT